MSTPPSTTPDGRYIVVRGRLWQMLPGVGDQRSRFGARCRTLAALCRTLGYLKAD